MSTGSSANLRIWYVDSTITFFVGSGRRLLLEGDDDMSGPIPAGVVKDLINTVVLAADGTPFTSAALCVIRLEQDGDTDDGKYWDGDSWETAADPPASAHQEAGQHFYQLPAAATTSRDGARLAVTFTDTITEGSMTTLCGTKEYLVGVDGLTAAQATQLIEVWKVHGLDVAEPLVVDSTVPAGSRKVPASAATIDQTTTTVGTVTTVARV